MGNRFGGCNVAPGLDNITSYRYKFKYSYQARFSTFDSVAVGDKSSSRDTFKSSATFLKAANNAPKNLMHMVTADTITQH